MTNKFQKTMLLLGLICSILGIAISPNRGDIMLNITIILWISNVYLLQTQVDKLSNK